VDYFQILGRIYAHTLNRHQLIVIWKTAYYSFYLPVALAMHFVGIKDEKLFEQAKEILIPLGEYFQVQGEIGLSILVGKDAHDDLIDDYLDCFGTHEQIGKIGTDIMDNKCSWCINIALNASLPEQRKILDVRLTLYLIMVYLLILVCYRKTMAGKMPLLKLELKKFTPSLTFLAAISCTNKEHTRG
jgi:hypothetical protein